MTISRRDGLRLAGAALLAAGPMRAAAQDATVHEVEMITRDPDTGELNVFKPDLIRAQPGDTIRFLPTDRGHNSQSHDEMIPEGAEEWNSRLNEEFEVTLETPGAYGYFCTPHQSSGMVGLILVGEVDPAQYEAIKEVRQRGQARQRYEDIFARADEMLAAEG